MKKGTVSFLSIVGTLAVLSGVAAGLYYGSKKVREATDGLISSIKGGSSVDPGSSVNPGSSETVSSSDGKLSVLLPQGRTFSKAAAGATKTFLATLNGNPSSSVIAWSSSDVTKVTVSPTTENGAVGTLTLVAPFSDGIRITGTAWGDPTVTCRIDVLFADYVTAAVPVGLFAKGDIAGGEPFLYCVGTSSYIDNVGEVVCQGLGYYFRCYSYSDEIGVQYYLHDVKNNDVFLGFVYTTAAGTMATDDRLSKYQSYYASVVGKNGLEALGSSQHFGFFQIEDGDGSSDVDLVSSAAGLTFTASGFDFGVDTATYVKPTSITADSSITF